MEDYIVREATLEDKDAILAIIDNVYDGKDYLEDCFEDFMSEPNMKAYVGLLKGEIIAFVIFFLVDDGQTVVTRAGRITQKHAGKGYFPTLGGYAVEQSGAKRTAFTVRSTDTQDFTKYYKQDIKLILSKKLQRYLFNPQLLQSEAGWNKSNNYQTPIKQATPGNLQQYMTSQLYRKYCFPDEVIIIDWVPYQLLPSNIPLLGIPGKTNFLTNLEVNENEQKGLLSVLTIFKTRDPPFSANLDIYGADPDALVFHIAAQIDYAKKRANGVLNLMVLFDEQLAAAAIEKAFQTFGLKQDFWRLSSNQNMYYSRQSIFAKL